MASARAVCRAINVACLKVLAAATLYCLSVGWKVAVPFCVYLKYSCLSSLDQHLYICLKMKAMQLLQYLDSGSYGETLIMINIVVIYESLYHVNKVTGYIMFQSSCNAVPAIPQRI